MINIMAPEFHSSFIPKGPAPTGEVFEKKKTSMLGVLAVLLFIVSIVAYGGLFAYKSIINNDIQNLQSQLADAEKSVDKGTINQMSQFSKKLSIAKAIVFKHQIISRFLTSLASSTVSSVQFTDFNYGNLEEGKLDVKLQGKASDYASVALQEDVLSKNQYFKSVAFSNLALSDKGLVSFNLAISVDPQISTYLP